jgi:ATP-dependent 26S proteasome regulatory subunit
LVLIKLVLREQTVDIWRPIKGTIVIHTLKMTLADDVNSEEFVMTKDEFSGADIKAICTEAGLLALRERRMKVRLNVLF